MSATRHCCVGWPCWTSTQSPPHSRCTAGDDRGLDARTTALVRLAGLVALQSSPQTYEWGVAAALDTGCSEDEVVAVLAALAPVVGAARVSSAAVNVATAIGCHVDVAGRD